MEQRSERAGDTWRLSRSACAGGSRADGGAHSLRAVVLCAIAGGLTLTTEVPAHGGVPAGREELLKTMVGHGSVLPAGCRFAGGSNAAIITAQYACRDGDISIQLRGPDDAPPDAVRTEHFALVPESGSVPPGFLDALAAVIRQHEADVVGDGDGGIPPEFRPLVVSVILVVAVVLTAQILIERRLSRARARPDPLAPSSPPSDGEVAADHRCRTPTLGLLLLVGGYLLSRLASLHVVPVFVDESIHILWAQAGFGTYFVPEVSVGKWLPLQWMTLAVHLPIDALTAVRAASVSLGLAAMLACVLINRELFSWADGLVAGVVYTILPFALLYDRLALADVYVTAFGAWCLLLSIVARRRPGAMVGLSLSLCTFAAILSKPTGAVFLPIPLLVGALLVKRGQRATYFSRVLPVVFGGTLLLIVLVAQGYGTHLLTGQSSVDEVGVPRLLANLETLHEWFVPLLTTPVMWVAAGGVLVAFARLLHGKWDEVVLLTLVPLSIVPYALVSTVWFPRYVLFVTVPVALLAGRTLVVAAGTIAVAPARVSPRWGGAARVVLLTSGTLALASAVMPTLLFLMTDPARAALPRTEHESYVGGWTSGYGLSELAGFLRERGRESPINVVRFDVSGPPGDGLDVYLRPSDSVRTYRVASDLATARSQVANLARLRPTLFVVNPDFDQSIGVAPSSYLGNSAQIWSYTRPGGETRLELWEVLVNE